MRMVNYRAKNADGVEFYTRNYKEATENGAHIIETYFTEIDERTEKEKKRTKEVAQKIQRILEAKRA